MDTEDETRDSTFARTLYASCRTQLLHCFKQVARADLFETNVVMDADLIVESGIEQARNIGSLLVHRKCTCIDQKTQQKLKILSQHTVYQ